MNEEMMNVEMEETVDNNVEFGTDTDISNNGNNSDAATMIVLGTAMAIGAVATVLGQKVVIPAVKKGGKKIVNRLKGFGKKKGEESNDETVVEGSAEEVKEESNN